MSVYQTMLETVEGLVDKQGASQMRLVESPPSKGKVLVLLDQQMM